MVCLGVYVCGVCGYRCPDLRAKDECKSKKPREVTKKSEESSFGRYELCDDERVATGGEGRFERCLPFCRGSTWLSLKVRDNSVG